MALHRTYNVLIVDDDRTIRNSFAQNPSWAECGFRVLSQAPNGADALEFLKSTAVDLVVTDICMPIVNGVELIRRARIAYPALQFLVISNYDDFEYVRTALKLGAFDYMLKYDASPTSLAEMLERIREVLEDNCACKSARAQVKAPIDVICDMILQICSGDECAALLEPASVQPDVFCGYPILIRTSGLQEDPQRALGEALRNDLGALHFVRSVDTRPLPNGVFVIFVECDTEGQRADTLSLVMCKTLQRFDDRATACLSAAVHGREELLGALCNIVNTLNLASIKNATQVIYAQTDPKAFCTHFESNWIRDALNWLICAFVQERIEDVAAAFEQIIEVIRTRKLTYTITIHIFHIIIVSLNRIALRNPSGNMLLPITYLDNSLTLHTAHDRLMGLCGTLNSKSNFPPLSVDRKEIGDAVRYMLDNLHKNVMLADVARHVNLSRNYFCRVFREDTGKSFVDYLNMLRIERARQLILGAEMALGVVSETVGFNNYHYFSTIFKRLTGASPAEFRAQALREKGVL